jgi:hypothetical protein
MISLLIFLTTLLFIVSTAIIDSDHINKGQYFDSHFSRVCQRLGFFLVISFFDISLSIASALLFVALFDGLLNRMLGKPLFHLGNTAEWDKFFRDQLGIYFFVKFGSLIVSSLLFVYA